VPFGAGNSRWSGALLREQEVVVRRGSVVAGLVGIVLLLGTVSCQDQAATTELRRFREVETKKARNIETVRRFYQHLDGFLNEADHREFIGLWAADSKRFGGSADESTRFEEMEPFLRSWYTAFPDLKHQILSVVADGDYVVVKLRYAGTQRGEFMGMLPSGKRIDCKGMHMLKLADGKIAELHFIDDDLTMLNQLGRELK
jgi:predicted ester cyclase